MKLIRLRKRGAGQSCTRLRNERDCRLQLGLAPDTVLRPVSHKVNTMLKKVSSLCQRVEYSATLRVALLQYTWPCYLATTHNWCRVKLAVHLAYHNGVEVGKRSVVGLEAVSFRVLRVVN